MKKQKRTVILLVLTALAFICTNFVACKNGSGDDGKQGQEQQEQTENKNEETPVVNLKTIILGNFSEDEKGAFKRLFPNSEFGTSVTQVDESYKVVICDIDDIPEKIAEDAYYILYTLDKTAFDNVMKVHEEEYEAGLWTEEAIEEMREYVNKWPYLFYGINRKTGAEYTLYSAEGNEEIEKMQLALGITETQESIIVEEGTESDLSEDDGAIETENVSEELIGEEKFYFMFKSLANWINEKESAYANESRLDLLELDSRAANVSEGKYKLDELGNMLGSSVGYEWVNKFYAPNPDKGREYDGYFGSGKWNVAYSYKPILLYKTKGRPGIYYLVQATVSVDNTSMWGGKKKYDNLRMVGLYFKQLTIRFIPSATNYTVCCLEGDQFPKPISDNTGKTTLSSSFKWNIGGEVAANVGYENGKGKQANGSGITAGIAPKFTIGAAWDDSRTTDVTNLQICNTSNVSKGIPEWKVICNFLPEYEWGKECQFTEGCKQCQNSAINFNCSWGWFIPFNCEEAYIKDNKIDKDGKTIQVVRVDDNGTPVIDISKLPKLNVTIEGEAVYGAKYKNRYAGSEVTEREYKFPYAQKKSFPVTNDFGYSQLAFALP